MIASKYRFILFNGRIGTRVANPLSVHKLKDTYTKEKTRLSYSRKLMGKVIFSGDDFKFLYDLEKSVYRCEHVMLTIQRKCGDEYVDWFLGRISLFNGEWDLDQCKVELDIETEDRYTCIEDQIDEEKNLFELIPFSDRVTVNTIPGTLEFTFCDSNDTDCPEGENWTLYRFTWDDHLEERVGTNYYARYNLGSGVTKPAVIYGYYEFQYTELSGEWGFKVLGQGETTLIDNGLKLKDVLEKLVQSLCPDLTVKSDFFQINPDEESSINYVTGLPSKVSNLILFQKSDVKRPGAGNNATNAPIELGDLLESLAALFNVGWDIDDNNRLIIEHISSIGDGHGLDLTSSKFKPYVFHKRKYKYDKSKVPKYERFMAMEAEGTDFVGAPIIYSGSCVNNTEGENEKLYHAEIITTDVEMVLNNPLPDNDPNFNDKVSDKGFVLIACDDDNGIITESGVLSSSQRLNNSLGFAQLHRDYWMHGRAQRTGMMNKVETTFLSTVKTKQQDKITVPLCCDDVFNPEDLIKTNFGWGEVGKAEFNLFQETMYLELYFDAGEGLADNQAPVALNDKAVVRKNNSITIDVLANDTDSDGSILPETLEIVATVNCIATINSEYKIVVNPSGGFTGNAFVQYLVKDNWGQPSNIATLTVFVYDTVHIPVAINDYYAGQVDTVLNVNAAGGLLANDTDDGGLGNLSIDPMTKATANGGVVTINSNGSFSYTPAASFSGMDSFTYVMKDATGIESNIATVYITVIDPTAPNAVSDSYRTKKDTVLNVAAAQGLLANDTDDGPLVCIVETKSTSQGGSVTINANGSFIYTPPSGYLGNDTFTYTAKDSDDKTDTANVTIKVNPEVYVRLIKTNINSDVIIEECGEGDPSSIVGSKQTADYYLYFYATSDGSVPLDVSGFGITINMRFTTNQITPSGPPQINDFSIVNPTGVQHLIIEGEIIQHVYWGCDGGEPEEETSADYSIRTGSDYVII